MQLPSGASTPSGPLQVLCPSLHLSPPARIMPQCNPALPPRPACVCPDKERLPRQTGIDLACNVERAAVAAHEALAHHTNFRKSASGGASMGDLFLGLYR